MLVKKMKPKQQLKRYLSAFLAILIVVCMLPTGLTAYALEEDNHTHTESCYAKPGDLICGKTETAPHTHTEACICPGGELICEIPERESHTHDDSCFSEIATTETASDSNATQRELICNLEETTGHSHEEDCYCAGGELICGLEESTGHTHNDDCYAKGGELICNEKDESVPSLLQSKGMEVNDFDSLQTVITNAEDNTETQIVISSDIEFSGTLVIPAGKIITFTIDGDNSAKLFPDSTLKNAPLIQIDEGATLTLDGDITLDGKSAARYVDCFGKFSMNNATMQGSVLNLSSEHRGGITVSGENASFTLRSGIIKNTTSASAYKAAVYVTNNAKAVMDGGYIQGNTFTNQFCAAVVVDNAEFEMNGGEISENSCAGQIQSAGGVLVLGLQTTATASTGKSATFTMNGGKISDNQSLRGGGVYVYAGGPLYEDFYSKASFTMNQGEISGNKALGITGTTGAGGGVYVEWAGEFTMNDGTISGNSTSGMGGGVATNDGFTEFFGKNPYSSAGNRNYKGFYYRNWPTIFPAAFTMNGGNIIENEAASTSGSGDEGCGGGVYAASNNVTLNAGNISDNSSGKQGGGVYVGSVPYVLKMYDVLITENSASVIGGGAWFCPTGDIDIFVNNGAALYGNSADGAADDLAAVHTYSSYHATISDRMLGGGSANWYQDGAIDTSYQLGGADTSIARYDANSGNNISVSDISSQTGALALKAVPNSESQALSASLAKLTITGNTSQRGGGIGSNGGVVIGKSYEGTRDLTITKEWVGSTDIPETVTIWVVINGHRVESVVLTADNNWTATVTGLPTGTNIDITIEEDTVANWKPSYAYGTSASGDMTATVTNTYQKVGNLTVSKTVSGSGANATQEFDFTVTLGNNTINGTYGDMDFTDGVATFKLKDGESKTATGLPAGTTYTVTEDSAGYTATKTGDTGTITASTTSTAAFNNHKSSDGGGNTPNPAKVILTASKTLDGVAPTGSNYSFVLKDESGNIIQTVTNNGGNVTFTQLSFHQTGTFTYTISEVSGTDSNINYDVTSYTVTIKVTKSDDYKAEVTYQKNGIAYTGIPSFANTTKTPGGGDDDNKITISVQKDWQDNNSASRPTSVLVQLYKDGVAYGDPVTLNAANGWKTEWTVDNNAKWTVSEVNIPNDYDSAVTHTGNSWTITNTLKPTPITPTPTPTTPTTPDRPYDNVPQTGDNSYTSLWLTLAILSFAGLVTIVLSDRRKKHTPHNGR